MHFKCCNKLNLRRRIKINFVFFGVLFFLIFVAGVFIFSIFLSANMALAVSGNYNKTGSGSLTINDWNNLPADFVDKAGDGMTGPLTLSENPTQLLQAATKQYVDSLTSATADTLITDLSGSELKVVCGQTTAGSTDWQQYSPAGALNELQLDVDTSAAGFTSVPVYLVSLGGSAGHFDAVGATSIYLASAVGFKIYVINSPLDIPAGAITPAQANSQNWHINWCGIGK